MVPRTNKYGAKKTACEGITYDSKAEAARAGRHAMSLRAGLIRGWTRQVTFRLGVPENVYRCDFLVFHLDGTVDAEDVKGQELAKFKRDKKLWAAYGPCRLLIVKGGKVAEVIEPNPRSDEEGGPA